MSRRFAIAMLFVVSSVHVFAQADSAQRSFGGDAVHLDLSVGDYRVTASSDDRIRVAPRTRTNDVSTRIDVNLWGTRADVRVVGPKEGFQADIQLPPRVGVVVTLAGGSLQLHGVIGSKDIAADTARVEIAVGDRKHYRLVRASVQSGDVTAPAFDEQARGVRSFEWTGQGGDDLRVRVKTGRVTLKH